MPHTTAPHTQTHDRHTQRTQNYHSQTHAQKLTHTEKSCNSVFPPLCSPQPRSPPTGPPCKSLLPLRGSILPIPQSPQNTAAQMRGEIRSPQVSGVEGKGKEELSVGTQGGKGGAAEVQSERK